MTPDARATRLQLLGTAAFVLLLLGALAYVLFVDADYSFVRHGEHSQWIAAPRTPSVRTVRVSLEEVPAVTFVRRFEAPEGGEPLRLKVRALRGVELVLNGERVWTRDWSSGGWKRTGRVRIGGERLEEENLLEAHVRNPVGPALLWLRAEDASRALGTGPRWGVRRAGGEAVRARVADDTLRPGATLASPRLGRLLRARLTTLAALLAGGILLAGLLRGPVQRVGSRRALGAVWAGLLGLWALHAGTNAFRLPAYMGFDGPDHLDYVRFLLEEGHLPLATDGPMMYHPPLFYALSAGLLALFDRAPEDARVLLRLLPLVAALLHAALAARLARRLFAGDTLKEAAALLFAGLVPVNLYMACYLSNETLHAALAGAGVVLASELLLRPGLSLRGSATAGALLGLSVLAKASSLVLVPVAAVFLPVKGFLADGARLRRAGLCSALVVGAAALVAGGFFLRNLAAFGTPVVGNWDVPGVAYTWWQPPGFHTPAYYLGFGGTLERPFFASFESLWDGLYSTLWGDGLLGGIAAWSDRHPFWNYEMMTLVYALALPATLLGVGGVASLAARSFRGSDLRRRAALAFLVTAVAVTGAAVLFATLRHPVYSMAKASYALSMTAPLALAAGHAFAELARALERRAGRTARTLYEGWAVALAAAVVLSFLG